MWRWAILLTVASGCTGLIDGDVEEPPVTVDASVPPDGGIADAADPPPPPPPAEGEPGPMLGSYFWTFYYVTDEQRYLDLGYVDNTKIYQRVDSMCIELADVPEKFATSLSIEGTGRLADDRVVNYTGSCACPRSPCYKEVDAAHPWGYGAQSRALVPFRSVAVDRNVITPFGRKLYVLELDGLMMPGDPPWGGFLHDGCVSADDTGGGIDGEHLDFFAALREHYLSIAGDMDLPSADHVTVYDGGARCP